MRKFLILCVTAFVAFSCANKNSAVISAQIDGADSKDILISQLDVNHIRVLDTVTTSKSGALKYEVNILDESPNFYYLSYGRKRLATVIAKPGDNIKVTTDTLGNNVKFEGSEESELLNKITLDYNAALAEFDKLSAELNSAIEAKDNAKADDLKAKISKLYVKYKQSAIKSIVANPHSFTNVSVLYQYFNDQLPVFAQATDIIFIRNVHDSLVMSYPNSVYVKSLAQQLANYDAQVKMNEHIAKASETSFPDITLPDINANKVSLSSLEGKPFILMFWTISEVEQKMYNNDLKDLYKKYHKDGLEIYQVCVDIDKTLWATAVKEQELPWISVCDGAGVDSPAVYTYNVSKLPTLFVFSKSGDLVAKDVFAKADLEKAIQKAVR
ncbi:MAG: TlpA family protein disulfide reductase [Bacteroidales bacterium]|nr:TlpA family protein disulfide reductase [Bacteroidales bacterium]MBR6540502.1 TlpA family protein disulfide reductase [Bacteroidales bacterium]